MTIPCLLMLLVAPGINPSADAQLREFVAIVIAGIAIFAATSLLFAIIHWRTSFRLLPAAIQRDGEAMKLSFSIKYLLVLTMLCAIVLATLSRLRFDSEPPPSSFLGGFDFFVVILIIGGASLSALVLPTLVVPLMILHRRPWRRVIFWALAFWAIVTFSLTAYWTLEDDGPWLSVAGYIVMAQLGPIVAGVFTGMLLQLAGWHLVRYQSDAAHHETASPAPSP
jgi:hypothetical protein